MFTNPAINPSQMLHVGNIYLHLGYFGLFLGENVNIPYMEHLGI